MDVIKLVGKYLHTPVGTICYNTDKVLTTVLDKENVEGFATIILRLASNSGVNISQEQSIICYQWLEHLAMYLNQVLSNPTFSKTFLQGFNTALRKNTFLTGSHLSIADVAAYYALYPIIERFTILEQEALVHVCRWMRHLQSLSDVCLNKPPLAFNTIMLSILAPAAMKPEQSRIGPLPKQLYPHELKDIDLNEPIIFFPQPFSFPGYPIILYL